MKKREKKEKEKKREKSGVPARFLLAGIS